MRRATVLLLFVLAVALSSACHANDTWSAGIGGTARPMPGEHPSVRMVRETVRMDLYPDYYETNVAFVFENSGKATTVTMGFPESGYVGVYEDKPVKYRVTFQKFSTAVDGKTVSARRTQTTLKDGNLDALWLKEVTFAANQRRHVTVRYRSPYGGTAVHGLSRFVCYDFTGQNWRGKVAESRLEIVSHVPGTMLISGRIGQGKGKEPVRVAFRPDGSPDRCAYVWKNWEAQAFFTMTFATTPKGWLTDGGGEVPGAWKNTAATVQTLTALGDVPTDRFQYCPPAFRRNGVTYARVSKLHDLLGTTGKVGFDEETKTGSFTASGHTFSLPINGAMSVDGKAVSAAPSLYLKPIWMGYPALYVPLEPIAAVLNRTVAVNEKERKITVTAGTRTARGGKD